MKKKTKKKEASFTSNKKKSRTRLDGRVGTAFSSKVSINTFQKVDMIDNYDIATFLKGVVGVGGVGCVR